MIYKRDISIDGIDIRQLSKKQLRSAIGQMQQDVFIFEGDVAYNIRLNDDNITDAQVKAAAEYVNASSFIEKLPQGYHEPVTRAWCDILGRRAMAFVICKNTCP